MEFSSLIVKPGKRSATRESSTIPDIVYLSAQRRSKTPETIQHSTTQRRAPTPKRVAFNEDMNVDSSDSQSGDEEDEEDELESGSELVKLIPKSKGKAGTTQRRAPTPKRVAFNEDMNVDSSDSQSGDEEDEEDELESGSELVKLIPKPKGEAGRPGSGGYNLQEELAWSERTYEAVVVSAYFDHMPVTYR
ncbi:LOW QUALITY PROTEIN: hypothetical protein CVT25_004684 [Psilocybe cyanescens]|uniref:Uncharacterized protein n=1 Tax=Psilocybe cyanescens TaxID=93625 RepID=A0A409XRS7_PSICY|nr:LOW QUALITY PROTEIN: hypothetical protein CVT25_004684 [Psilocybe cyanescens]